MKKILSLFLVIFTFILISSCSKVNISKDDSAQVEYNFSENGYSTLVYNGVGYTQYDGPWINNFYPYIYLLESNGDTAVELNEEFIVDSRDMNCNFICSTGGLLRSFYFVKDGVEIPALIENAEHVNSIWIELEGQRFNVNDKISISIIIDYFSSEEVTSLKETTLIPRPTENIIIEAYSDYYGGAFVLGKNITLDFKGGKLILSNGSEQIEAPAEINEIIVNQGTVL